MNGDIEKIKKDFYLNTGSPHYISYCKGLPQKNIVEFGKDIRYNDRFKTAGTNVNLVEILGENKIAVRTYERGVEDETLACGTGATASALTFAFAENLSRGKIDVQVQGGQLGIYFEQDITMNRFQNIWLEGPAEYVFKGELNG
jgi:diaminopimelate epimerase